MKGAYFVGKKIKEAQFKRFASLVTKKKGLLYNLYKIFTILKEDIILNQNSNLGLYRVVRL